MRALILFIIGMIVTGSFYFVSMSVIDPVTEHLDDAVNQTISASKEKTYAHNLIMGISNIAGIAFVICIIGSIICYAIERMIADDERRGGYY